MIVIAPFDTADLPLKYRIQLLPPYGILAFIGYMILIPIQNWIYKKVNHWSIPLEAAFVLTYNILVLPLCFAWYKTDAVNGTFSFAKFTLEVYNPIFFMVLSVMMIARWFIWREKSIDKDFKMILRGENKKDVLRLDFCDLICISSADNYVEINYLKEGTLHKKLLRNTLKNMSQEVDGLIQVHRSYLINPLHFREWKNGTTIALTQMQVPTTKTYKKNLKQLSSRP